MTPERMDEIERVCAAAEKADGIKDWVNAALHCAGPLRETLTALRERDAEIERLASENGKLREAVEAVHAATAAYLPPDGIDVKECINRILAATDNPEINAVILERRHGHA